MTEVCDNAVTYDTAIKAETLGSIITAIQGFLDVGEKATCEKVAKAANLSPNSGRELVAIAVRENLCGAYSLRKAEGIVPSGKPQRVKNLDELKKEAEKAKKAADRAAAALAAAQG